MNLLKRLLFVALLAAASALAHGTQSFMVLPAQIGDNITQATVPVTGETGGGSLRWVQNPHNSVSILNIFDWQAFVLHSYSCTPNASWDTSNIGGTFFLLQASCNGWDATGVPFSLQYVIILFADTTQIIDIPWSVLAGIVTLTQ